MSDSCRVCENVPQKEWRGPKFAALFTGLCGACAGSIIGEFNKSKFGLLKYSSMLERHHALRKFIESKFKQQDNYPKIPVEEEF